REEVGKREVRSIARAAEEVRCGRLEVVTWDYEGAEAVGDGSGREVRFVPLWRWLLERGPEGIKSGFNR
ncbi:MAG TPA: hypothetical protein P5290_06570, partial [Candidatus Methanomethylicus sp.]|nr:hypothetical protein [Candidatus Methanomethylicus sp.]